MIGKNLYDKICEIFLKISFISVSTKYHAKIINNNIYNSFKNSFKVFFES